MMTIALGARADSLSADGFYPEPFIVPSLSTHTATINQIDADAAGRFLVTGSDDKSIRVWSQASGHLLSLIRIATGPGFIGRIYALALSPDGTRIAAGGFTDARPSESHIYLFDRATGQQIGLIGGLPGVVNQLAFSPDGAKLAAVLGGTHGVRLFNVREARQIGADSDYGDSSHGIAFDHDGRVVTTAFDGKIRLYSPELRRLRVVVAPNGAHPLGVAFQPQGSLLAVGYFDTPHVDLIDGSTLALVQVADTTGIENGDLARVAWSFDGTRLFAAGRWQRGGQQPVRAWSEKGRRIQADYLAAENTITGLKALPDGSLAVVSGDPRVTLLDRSGAKSWVIDPQMADYRGQQRSLAVSSDATKVRFDFDIMRSMPAQLDLHQRLLDTNPPPDPAPRPAVTDSLHAVWLNTTTPTLDNRPLVLDPQETSRAIAVAPEGDSFVLGAEWSLRRFRRDGTALWRVATPGVAWAVNIPSDGRSVVAAFSDGTIRWYRLTDGAELLAFFPHRDGKRWVAWNPSGYYMASPGGEELIQWQINHGWPVAPEVVSAAHFRDRFYRPEVIQQVLARLDADKALAAADRQAGRQTVVQTIVGKTPPVVVIIDPQDNAHVDQNDIVVNYTLTDRPGTLIQQVRLRADGRVVATHDNLEVPNNGSLSRNLQATLDATAVSLSLDAESSNGWSDPVQVRIKRAAAQPGDKKSNLYALAVGIGTFQDKTVTHLQYPGKDAEDFAKRMKAQKGGLYDQVDVRILVDEQATKKAISDGLYWLERQMQQNDVAAIFFSTHGDNDAAKAFYLVPYDATMSDEIALWHTAVHYTELRDTLSRLAKKGTVVIFLDACHTGSVVTAAKGLAPDVDGVANDLAKSDNGVVVFTSSTGTQLSLERPDLRHGVFTYALLEAFEGKASGVPPWLDLTDLKFWLGAEVKRLTIGAQIPQTAIPTQLAETNPRIFRVTGVMP